MRMTSRRSFLAALAAAAVSPALPACAQVTAPRFSADPFALGVASGYPHPGGMVLWTRLAGALDPVSIPVRWEVAADYEWLYAVPLDGPTPFLVETANSTRRTYHPMDREHAALFRVFADTEVSQEGVIAFARQYGLLGPPVTMPTRERSGATRWAWRCSMRLMRRSCGWLRTKPFMS